MQQDLLPKTRASTYDGNTASANIPQDWGPKNIALPSPKLPPPDLVQIIGKAQAYCQGLINLAQVRAEVAKHHDARARTAISESSEEPRGMETAARTRLAVIKDDLASTEKALKGVDKYVEEQVPQKPVLTPAEKAQMALLSAAGVGLAIFSVYGTKTFVDGAGLLSGAATWGIALGPIFWAVVVKIWLGNIGNTSPKRLPIQILTGIVAVAAVVWITTLALEASSALAKTSATLALSPTTETSTTGGWWLIVRAVAMMCIELAGAAVITDKFFDIWMHTGCADGWTKMAVINPKFAAYDSDKAAQLQQQSMLEHVIGSIEAWHAANEIRISEYVSRAVAILESNIATLGGMHHAAA